MKLQIQSQRLRLRVDESELERLLAGGHLTLALGDEVSPLLQLDVCLGESLDFASVPAWHLKLPRDQVVAHAQRLPCRDALSLSLVRERGEPLGLDFEVDVRDSVRARGPHKRSQRESTDDLLSD